MFHKRNATEKVTPIKEEPLHVPGQSLQQEISDLMDGPVLNWALIIAGLLAFAGLEWWRWIFNLPPRPVLATVIFVPILIYGISRLIHLRKKLQNLKEGRKGELAVGQVLDDLRKDGYRVFHDIPGDGYNIDHILIGPTGVYAIETKTLRKNNADKLFYDGTTITYEDGRLLPINPLPQAKMSAKSLYNILFQESGQRIMVKPVVLFPGHWIERRCNQEEVWVLNPKRLIMFLIKEPISLQEEQIIVLKESLARYIRRKDQEKSA